MKKELLLKFLQVSGSIKIDMRQYGVDGKGRQKMSLATKNALLVLAKQGNINQRTLSKHLKVSAQAVSEIIKKLEQQELIERRKNKINNENIIIITEKGKEFTARFENVIDVVADNLFQNLSIEEQQILFILLNKVKGNGISDELGS